MIAIGVLFVRMLCDFFKPRPWLEAEILILRHQLNVLQQRTPRRRLHLRWIDRALFMWECFSDLARQPLGRRVAGHRKPQQSPTFVAENKSEGRSSKSAMADPAAVPCRWKPWTGRPRCRA